MVVPVVSPGCFTAACHCNDPQLNYIRFHVLIVVTRPRALCLLCASCVALLHQPLERFGCDRLPSVLRAAKNSHIL